MCVVSVRGVHPTEERSAMFHENLRGIKIWDKYTKFGQLIIRKSLKLLPPDVTF